MALVFKYKIIKRPDGTEVKEPLIPITLNGKEKIETMAILDSGADMSAMHKSFAEILGLNLNGEKKQAFGVGGKVETIQTKVNITIEKSARALQN
jgi:hypothetical protein